MATPHTVALAALYIAAEARDINGDGVVNQEEVNGVRQALVDGGVACDSANGNHPDRNRENIRADG